MTGLDSIAKLEEGTLKVCIMRHPSGLKNLIRRSFDCICITMVFGLASVNVKETNDWKKLEADIIEESIASNESAIEALRNFLLEVRNPNPEEQSGGVYSYEGIYGWVAGGGIPVLNTKDGSYVALVYRDEDAPTYPNTFTITSGLSESWKEMTNLRTLSVRETIEELLITVDDDRWVKPRVSEEVITSDYVDSIVSDRVTAWQQETGSEVPPQKYEPIDVSSQPLGSDSLTLSYGDEVETISGHFVIDTEHNMIDLVDVIHFDLLDYSIEDLQVYDGEMVDGVLDRYIHLVKLSDIESIFDGSGVKSRYIFRSGEVVAENGVYDDPVTLVGASSAKSLESSDVLPMG